MSDTDENGRKSDSSGTGLTLKQLVLEVREDVRSIRLSLDKKADRSEFELLKDRVDRALSGEATNAYATKMLDEYRELQKSVKQLEKDREAATTAREIAEKSQAQVQSSRRWILGLVVSTVLQGAVIVYGVIRGVPQP